MGAQTKQMLVLSSPKHSEEFRNVAVKP